MKRILIYTACSVLALSCTQGEAQMQASEMRMDGKASSGPERFMDQTGEEIALDLDTRFRATVTESTLQKATSLHDIVPAEEMEALSACENVRITLLGDEPEKVAVGNTMQLNTEQQKLLRSMRNSMDFFITADCTQQAAEPQEYDRYDLVYYFSIVPPHQASYEPADKVLVEQIRSRVEPLKARMISDKLESGKVAFTVTEEGALADVHLESSSGDEELDNTVLELIKRTSGKWTPARNQNNEPVKQVLVFSFGTIGC